MTEKTYEVIETSIGYTFIQATDKNGKKFAIPTDSNNNDYQEYLASTEATEPEEE